MDAGNSRVTGDCRRVAPILSLIGDKWSVLVIMEIGDAPLRFNEIRRRVDGISQRMLTFTLRGLERSGIVSRTVTPTNPPRVDYALTDLGRSLLEPIHGLGRWARANADRIEAAQLRYDAGRPGAAAEPRSAETVRGAAAGPKAAAK